MSYQDIRFFTPLHADTEKRVIETWSVLLGREPSWEKGLTWWRVSLLQWSQVPVGSPLPTWEWAFCWGPLFLVAPPVISWSVLFSSHSGLLANRCSIIRNGSFQAGATFSCCRLRNSVLPPRFPTLQGQQTGFIFWTVWWRNLILKRPGIHRFTLHSTLRPCSLQSMKLCHLFWVCREILVV